MRAAPRLLALLLLPGAAGAADGCAQDKAVYQDRPGGYELHFGSVDSASAATSHLFTLTHLPSKTRLDGVVIDTDAPVRSNAIVMKDCPEGDVTGADLEACTGFDGYAYAITQDGEAGNLPPGAAPAAHAVLLAGLGPSLAASPLGIKLKLAAPADVFAWKECRP